MLHFQLGGKGKAEANEAQAAGIAQKLRQLQLRGERPVPEHLVHQLHRADSQQENDTCVQIQGQGVQASGFYFRGPFSASGTGAEVHGADGKQENAANQSSVHHLQMFAEQTQKRGALVGSQRPRSQIQLQRDGRFQGGTSGGVG